MFKWHKRFAQGGDNLEDNEHTAQPRIVRTGPKIQEVAMLVCFSCFQMVDGVATAGISYDTCHKILSAGLNMSHVTQHSVPCILMQDQRDGHMNTHVDLISSADKDRIVLNWIITGNGIWYFLYDSQLKQQSATWKSASSPRRKKL
jgi:hypothetical protein